MYKSCTEEDMKDSRAVSSKHLQKLVSEGLSTMLKGTLFGYSGHTMPGKLRAEVCKASAGSRLL